MITSKGEVDLLDLRLPLFEGSLVVGSQELPKQSNPLTKTVDGSQMVRMLQLFAPRYDSLALTLKTADTELAQAARLCGAKVVDHTWGLSKLEELAPTITDDEIICDTRLIPEDYVLVALVNIIRSNEPNVRLSDDISWKVDKYNAEGGSLADMGSNQFSIGYEHNTCYQGLILHDIDPWFGNNTPKLTTT